MEWLKRLSSAVDYIEEHLTDEISYDEAAKIACCSTYYFQRMFSYVAGISLSDYIRRRKMTQAAFELQTADCRVTDIALKYGYASPTAFNRAFQNVHGIAPAAAKAPGNLLNAYPPIRFAVTVTGDRAMPYRIESKQAMRIVGIRQPLTADMEENKRIAPAFWQEILSSNRFPEICRLCNHKPHGILGITLAFDADEIYYYIAAATDRAAPAGMYEYEIPAATWVIFESEGPLKESVHTVFKRFLTEWLPFSSYEYAHLPDIEVYPVGGQYQKNGHSEVWIGIKREKENET